MSAKLQCCDRYKCAPALVDGLIRRLIEAAALAISNERSALEHPIGHVRGITVELVLSSTGQVSQCVAYVERRTTAGALLGRPLEKAGKEPSR